MSLDKTWGGKERGCDTIVFFFLYHLPRPPRDAGLLWSGHVTQEDWVLSNTRDPDPGTGAQMGKGC